MSLSTDDDWKDLNHITWRKPQFGGKDSCFNMMHCVTEGHQIVALANLKPEGKDELDSYMYQTVGHHAIDLYAEAMGLPLYRRIIKGGSIQQGSQYHTTEEDEVEDLYNLLKDIKDNVEYEAVSVGAILSDYQRVRVEHVCQRLGLTPLCYLWRRDQEELLSEMIECGVHAIIIKVAALGLSPEKHLGKTLADIQPHMLLMSKKYGLNPCGEGGEYETFTLDCPLFKKRIVIDEQEMIMHSEDAFAPVAYLNFNKMHIEEKNISGIVSERVKYLPLKRSCDTLKELDILQTEPIKSLKTERQCIKCTVNRLQIAPVYSRSCRNGTWYSASNVMSWQEDGETVASQTKCAMQSLQDHLEKLSLKSSDLIAVHLYVSNLSDFGNINNVYRTYFGVNPPIRICVEASLPVGVMLQLDCLAYKSNNTNTLHRHTMHVQGLSHWAPANIGPYSQGVQIGELIYVAGQIALVPGNMKIIEGGIIPQSSLSLRHVDRILKAINSNCDPNCVRLVICYITESAYIDVARRHWNNYRKSSSDGNSCIMQCVVIPRLPRDALIEWQVYATCQPYSHVLDESSEFNNEWYRSKCKCQLVETETLGQVCSFICITEIQTSKDICDDVDQVKCMLNVTLRAIQKVIQKLGDEETVMDIIASFRIFYCTKYFKGDHLFIEYDSTFQEIFEKSSVVPPIFVPVISLESDNHILMICH